MTFGFGAGFTPWVQRLIIANVVMFVLQNMVPGFTAMIEFVPSLVLYRPWTLITYMFAHGGFGHIFFNMLALFFFGPPLESRWGSNEFIKYYILCGLGGAALSFMFAHASIIGASAAVYGVMLAFAMNWPDAPIYIWGIFPLPAKYLIASAVVISLFSAFGNVQDGTAHFAHLGGFAAGFLYLKMDRKGGGLFTRVRKMVTKSGMKVTPGGAPADQVGAVGHMRSAGPLRGKGAPVTGPTETQMLNDLDRVLDKISTQGMNSLTAGERKLLDEASRRYRQN
nr:Rhomboid family [uncultured bacterium]